MTIIVQTPTGFLRKTGIYLLLSFIITISMMLRGSLLKGWSFVYDYVKLFSFIETFPVFMDFN